MAVKFKRAKAEKKQTGKRNPVVSVFISVFAAFIISLVLIAAAALLLQNQTLGIESVKIINPIIKSVSALAAALIAARRINKKSWLVGMTAGFAYALLSFLIFSLLSGSFSIGTGTLSDLLMCSAAGMAGGIIQNLAHNS